MQYSLFIRYHTLLGVYILIYYIERERKRKIDKTKTPIILVALSVRNGVFV